MSINWDETYTIGVKEIDEQHHHFVSILNKLYEYINLGKKKEEMSAILGELIMHTELHFATEEKYFDEFNYELKDEHKALHKDLKEKVLEFHKQFLSGEKDITLELLDFLENWLLDHMANQDKKYIKCFHDHGLS